MDRPANPFCAWLRAMRRARPTLIVLFALLALLLTSWVNAARYVYDGNGRLVVVTNEGGQSARYVYDKLGNLLRIERLAAGELAVFTFSPTRGAPGVNVRIQGQGFSTSVASNQVSFNGTLASISSANATELVAQVPVGATSGPITVQVGTQTASGPVDFVVDENAEAPTIENVGPLVVAPGAAVTITGTHLMPIPDQTQVTLDGRLVMPSTASNAQITFTVPTKASTGRVAVGTPYGRAVSEQTVIVVPSGIDPADLVPAGELAADGGAKSLSVSSGNQRVALLIDGRSSAMNTLQFSALSSDVSYTLYGPGNVSVATGTARTSSPSVHLPKLGGSTYLLVMKPVAAPGAWNVLLEADRKLVPGGDTIITPMAGVGQSRRLYFESVAGQNVGIGLKNLVVSGSGTYMNLYAYKPDGGTITSASCYPGNGGCDLNLANVGGGLHTVIVAPASATQAVAFDATASPDLVAELEPDVLKQLTLPRSGQNARLTFDAEEGEAFALLMVDQATLPVGKNVTYVVYQPNGTALKSLVMSANGVMVLPKAPVAGRYTVMVDPYYAAATQVRLVLSSGTQGAKLDGVTSTHATTAGDSAHLSFMAAQGQNIGIGISGLTVGSGTYVTLLAYGPSGTSISSTTCYASNEGCDLNLANLTAGPHSIVVSPQNSGQTMAFTATLSTDAVMVLQPDVPQQVSLPRRGQNGRLLFAGEQGQSRAIQVAEQVAAPAGRSVTYMAYKPDGTVWKSGVVSAGGTVNLATLPASGTYTVFVDPYYAASMSSVVTLATGTTNGTQLDGASGNYALMPGQTGYATFTATQGQNIGVGLSDLTLSNGTYMTLYAYRPDGTSIASVSCYSARGGCDLNLPNLPAGTYSLGMIPANGTQAMGFKTTVSTDRTGVIQADVPMSLQLDRRGQNGRLAFNASAGDTLALRVSGQTTLPAGVNITYQVYKPDGTVFKSGGVTAGGIVNLVGFPNTGAYTLFVDPADGATASANLELSSGTVEGTQPDGNSGAYATAAGQPGYLRFVATQGQNLGLGISELALSSGTYMQVHVYKPDGNTLASTTCYASNDGCELNLPNLGAGTYSVVTTPQSQSQSMTYKATLSTDVALTLQPNVPVALQLPRRGQNARLTFAGTAGQNVAILASDVSTAPQKRTVYFTAYRPDGSVIRTAGVAGGTAFTLPALATAGTYTVLIDPEYGVTAAAQLQLDTVGVLKAADEPLAYASPRAGVEAYFSFIAEAGANMGLGFSDMALSSGTYFNVYVYGPSGSQVSSASCYPSNGGCELNLPNLAGGMYSIRVAPTLTDQVLSFKLSLSPDVAVALQPDVTSSLSLGRRGQNGRLAFAGTAGQRVAIVASSQSTAPQGKNVYYNVYKPDGTLLRSSQGVAGAVVTLDLPTTGSYGVLVDPQYGVTATAQVRLDTQGSLQPGSGPIDYTTPWANAEAYFTFLAPAGANMGLGVSDLTVSSGTYVNVYVYAPGGSTVNSTTCYVSNGGCELNLPNLVGGMYSAKVVPVLGDQSVSFKVALSHDIAVTLQPDVPVSLNLSRRGQNGRLSFSGTAGQRVAIMASEQSTVPQGRTVYYTAFKPDGTTLRSSDGVAGAALTLDLPTSGTYSVLMDPQYGATATALVRLETQGSLQAGANPVDYATPWANAEAYFTFLASAGTNMGVGISDLVINGTGTYANVYVYGPSGATITSAGCYPANGGCELNLPNLAGGMYSVKVIPAHVSQTLNFKVALSSDVAIALQPDSPVALNLSRRGQNGRLSFSGSAGQRVAIVAQNQNSIPVGKTIYYTAYKPDGTVLRSSQGNSSAALTLDLPVTGNYNVLVDPQYGASLAAQVRLDTQGLLQPSGDPMPFSGPWPNAEAYFTFLASAGAKLGLGISDLLINDAATSYANVYVYRPNGTTLTSTSCYAMYGGCELNLSNLPAGMYSVLVMPAATSQVLAFKATVSNDTTSALQFDAPYSLGVSRRGQNARLTFQGVASQSLALQVTSQVTQPVVQPVSYVVQTPDGASWKSMSVNPTNGLLALTSLPQTGTYTVFVDPSYGMLVNTQLNLDSTP